MSQLIDRLESRFEFLRNNPSNETKEELKELRYMLFALSGLIKAELTLDEVKLEDLYKLKEAIYSKNDYETEEIYEIYFLPVEFLLSSSGKYTTIEEIDECLKEEVKLLQKKKLQSEKRKERNRKNRKQN